MAKHAVHPHIAQLQRSERLKNRIQSINMELDIRGETTEPIRETWQRQAVAAVLRQREVTVMSFETNYITLMRGRVNEA